MIIKDLLFPKFCFGCGFVGVYICPNCQKNLRSIKEHQCLYCNRNSYLGFTHPGCLRADGVDGFFSLYYYDNLLKKTIKNIKYRGVKEALTELLLLINLSIVNDFKKTLSNNLIVQPIPLHRQREKERGFNQSELIAREIIKNLNQPIDYYLSRQKKTLAQAQIKKRDDRYKNMIGAFYVIKSPIGLDFLLVDDVVTTGSTIKEAARELKKAGANKVFAFALAKG